MQALKVISDHIPSGGKVLELYSGAGTIGIMLAKAGASVHAAEIVPAAVEAALFNAQVNATENYRAECLSAEKIDATLFVIREDVSLTKTVRNALDALHTRQVNVLGLIYSA